MRDSPNGNSYRSESPDSESPRDRTYQSKGSFIQKVREKERENRDYKSRDKYSAVVVTSEFTRSERRDVRPSARAGGYGQQKLDVVTDDSCFDVSRSTNITMEDKRSTHAHSDGIL
ncbi:hypothetical protein J6590_035328 [Homalodisca vitripennis]|nr:hypothetical protein J6590_035328 [Homalodisca vitripennis]